MADVFHTENIDDFEFHTGFRCCKDYSFDTANAYLSETAEVKRHDMPLMESPASVVCHCMYERGACNLKDGSLLIWVADKQEGCEYVYQRSYIGKFQADTWLSDDDVLALTFSKNQLLEIAAECGQDMPMSNQGIAVNRSGGKRHDTVSDKTDRFVAEFEPNA